MTHAQTQTTEAKPAGAGGRSWLLRSPDEARAELEKQGVSIYEWSQLHGFTYSAVRRVLSGGHRCRFGVGHKIAVALGMKPAYINEVENGRVGSKG